MFRGSAAANAAYAFVYVTPGNNVLFETRASNGGTASYSATVAAGGSPVWVRLIRSGSSNNQFTAQYSLNGAIMDNTWERPDRHHGHRRSSWAGGMQPQHHRPEHVGDRQCHAQRSCDARPPHAQLRPQHVRGGQRPIAAQSVYVDRMDGGHRGV